MFNAHEWFCEEMRRQHARGTPNTWRVAMSALSKLLFSGLEEDASCDHIIVEVIRLKGQVH